MKAISNRYRRTVFTSFPAAAKFFKPFVAVTLLSLAASSCSKAPKVETVYQQYCLSCHGADLKGGLGGSLVDDEWKHGASDNDISRNIRDGLAEKGMPAWGKTLSEEQLRALVIYIRERGAAAKQTQLLEQTSPQAGVFNSQKYRFDMTPVAEGFEALWAMDFLPDGSILTTEKQSGRLWRLQGEKKIAIAGIPKSWPEGQGGLMEVKVLPGNTDNPWVYLSYSEEKAGKGMTAIVRGKITNNTWSQQEDIFHAPQGNFLSGGLHFGSRIVFKDDMVFFSIGERGRQDMAQDLSVPNGKIHRLHLDGRTPKDNPFVSTAGAMPSIWSYGHRNPQGMALATNGQLWATEHGPRGGDETNLILKGRNYGWPVITHGMNYDGTPITDKTHHPDMEQPSYYWVPSIAVTALEIYGAKTFPLWNKSFLVGSLAREELQRLEIVDGKLIHREVLLKNQGRIRDITTGPNGKVYLVINRGSPKTGAIYQLSPVQ